MKLDTDCVSIACGPKKHGKSTIARSFIRRALDAGRWVYAHDPLGQYRKLCAPYKNAKVWSDAAAAAAKSGAVLPRGAAFRTNASIRKESNGREFYTTELVELVDQLGERYNTQTSARWPMSLVFDEGSLLGQSTWIEQGLNELISQSRHRQVEVLLLCQRKAQLSDPFWELTTDVFLFRQPRRRSKALEEPLCLDAGVLAGLEKLKKFSYVRVVNGDGPSTEKL